MRGGGGGGAGGGPAAAASHPHQQDPTAAASVRSYRHELCFLPSSDSAAPAAAPVPARPAAAGGDHNSAADSDGSTTDDGGGAEEQAPPEPRKVEAAPQQPLELVGGENFVSVTAAANEDDYALGVGPDPTPSGGGDGVILLVDVDGQYVAVKDIRGGQESTHEAAGGAQIYLHRRKRRQLLAAATAAAAAEAAAAIPPRSSPTAAGLAHASQSARAQQGNTDQTGEEKKKKGGGGGGGPADIEGGYDTDDENDDYLARGEQLSVARSKHSGGGGPGGPGTPGGGGGGGSNAAAAAAGAEYGPPEPLPRRQMRLLHRGDRLVVRFGHRTIRLEYHQKRRLEVDAAGTDDADALMSTSVDADGAAKVAFVETGAGGAAAAGGGGSSPANKLNGAPSSSPKAASPAKAGARQKEPPASAHPHGPARGTITFQDDDDTTTTDGAVRRLIGIPVAVGKQSGASSDGASTNAAVVVEAKKPDDAEGPAAREGTKGSGSNPASPIPAVVAAPAGAGLAQSSGAQKSARRSSAQSPEQQKRFSQSPQVEGDDDDEMEEYSYLTGEVIMKDQGYVSAITGDDEETDMEHSAENAHRKRSKIEAANRALGIDTANNAVGGVNETAKSAGAPKIDGKPRGRETEEDAATASAVVLDANVEKKVTIKGDGGVDTGAIQPPKAIEFPSQPPNEMPPPPSTVGVTDTAISALPSTQKSAKKSDDEVCDEGEVAATSSPDGKKSPEAMDVEEDNAKAAPPADEEENFADAQEQPMFLTAQEKDEDDGSDDETRDDGDKGTGGDAQDVEMEDVHDANAAAGSIDSDSDGSDADNEQEEGGALTQAYPMPTSPGISDTNDVNTPENSPHRSRTSDNADVDVDDDEITTAGPDQDEASQESIDIYDQPTQPNPALRRCAEDSPERFDLDTQPFRPPAESPSPARSSQNRESVAAALAPINEESAALKSPNKSGNVGPDDDDDDDDDDDSVTTAGSAPLLDEKKDTAKAFTTNKTEDESIPTDAAVAALSVPTSVAGGDTPKPHVAAAAVAAAQETVADGDIDSDATEDDNAITTEAAVGAPSALSSLPTSDAGDKPSNIDDSETEDENEKKKGSVGASGAAGAPPKAAVQPADLLTSIARLSQTKAGEDDDISEETTVCQIDVSEDGGDEGAGGKADNKAAADDEARMAIVAQEEAEKRHLEQQELINREQKRQRLDKERLDTNVQLLDKIKATRREEEKKRAEQERLDAERKAAEEAEKQRLEEERIAAQEAEKKRIEEERAIEEARVAEEKRIEEEKAAAKAAADEAEAKRIEEERAAAEAKAEEERIAAQKKEEEEGAAAAAAAAKASDTPEKKESQSPSKRQKKGRYSLRDSDEREAKEDIEGQGEEDGSIRVIITGITATAKHKNMVESIGGELIEKVDDAINATHAIAGDGKVPLRRTPKLMICVCKTPNILNLDWLTKSSKAKEPLDAKDFLLLDDTSAEKTYDFNMKDTLENGEAVRSQRGGLLGGWSIHFCKGVAGKKAPPEHELRLIVAAAGGMFLKTLSARATKDVDASKVIIITSDPATAAQKSDKDVKRLTSQGARVFTTKWFFHSIITQHLSEIEDEPVSANEEEDDGKKPAASSPKKGGRKRKAATPSSNSPKRESRRRKR